MVCVCEVVINIPRNAATVGTHKTAGDKVGTTKRMLTITTLKTLGHEYLIRGKFRHTHFYIVPFTGNHVVKIFDIRHGWKRWIVCSAQVTKRFDRRMLDIWS